LEIFDRWEVVLHLPDHVGKKNQNGDESANPNPRLGKFLPGFGQDQSYEHGKSEE
jgi:hypothetical protein